MDILTRINSTQDLNGYISLKQNLISLNQEEFKLSIAKSLPKIGVLEVQFFKKYQASGAAFLIFTRLLRLPPSNEWRAFFNDLVLLLINWISAARKHLIDQCRDWWTFLKTLLEFINELRLKHQVFQSGLAQFLTEHLLVLISDPRLGYSERYEVLLCLANTLRASNKKTRNDLLLLDNCFEKAGQLLTAPHPPTQSAALEVLLRVLTRRKEAEARRAVLHWLPAELPAAARELWELGDFNNFAKDARHFLNAVNAAEESVASASVKFITIGWANLATNRQTSTVTWVDVSAPLRCVTVMLERALMLQLGADVTSWRAQNELLTVTADTLDRATLERSSASVPSGVTLSMSMLAAPQYLNPSTALLLPARELRLRVVGDLRRLDRILHKTFRDKYTPMKFTDNEESFEVLSPAPGHGFTRFSSSDDDKLQLVDNTSVIPKRRSHSELSVRSQNVEIESNTSAGSIIQLPEKLRALPPREFKIGRAPLVTRSPTVSTLLEESERAWSTASTVQIQPPPRQGFRVSDKNLSQSRPIYKEGKPTRSVALVASDGEERPLFKLLPTSVIDSPGFCRQEWTEQLFQEATMHTNREQGSLSAKPTDEKAKTHEQVHSEAIENTPIVVTERKPSAMRNEVGKIHCTVLSTSDESNTESVIKAKTSDESAANILSALPQSPINYVNDRRRKGKENIGFSDNNKDISKPTYDKEDEDDIFFKGIIDDEIAVSPTVARRINESSSESNVYDVNCLLSNVERTGSFEIAETAIDFDVVDCLNNMIDSVCKKICRYTGHSEVDLDLIEQIEEAILPNAESSTCVVEDKVPEINADACNTLAGNYAASKPRKQEKKPLKVRLSFNKVTARKQKVIKNKPAKKEKNKLEVKEAKPYLQDKGNCIVNVATENIQDKKNDNNGDSNENKSGFDTPLERRKRKLYSPKGDKTHEVSNDVASDFDSEDNVRLAALKQNKQLYTPISMKTYTSKPKSQTRTPKSAATSYIQNKDQNKICRSRNRKSMQKSPGLSPRSLKKNQIFDQMKNKITSNDNIKLVDKKSSGHDLTVYNFTSSSEDDQFQTKRMELSKPVSAKKGRPRTRAVKGTKNKDKRVTKNRTPKGRKLTDEKMRDAAADDLNASFIIEDPNSKNSIIEPEQTLNVSAVMETMPVIEVNDKVELSEVKTVKKMNDKLSLKKEKGGKVSKNKKTVIVRNRSESPLPALIIESASKQHDTDDGSTTSSKLEKMFRQSDNYIDDTTQNLLIYDVEAVDFIDDDPTEIDVAVIPNVTGEYSKRNTEICKEPMDLVKAGNSAKNQKIPKKKPKMDIIDTTEPFNGFERERSITTVGHSPITVHGDFDEPPPNTESLQEIIHQRNLEVQDTSPATQQFRSQLCRAIENPLHASVIPLHTPQSSSENFKRKPIKKTAIAENFQLKRAKRNAKTEKQKEKSKSAPNTKIPKRKRQTKKCLCDNESQSPTSTENQDKIETRSLKSVKLQTLPVKSIPRMSYQEDRRYLESPESSVDEIIDRPKIQDNKSINNSGKQEKEIEQSSSLTIYSSKAPTVVLSRMTNDEWMKFLGWRPNPLLPEPNTQRGRTNAKDTIKEKPKTNKNVNVHILPLEVITMSDNEEEARENIHRRVDLKINNKNKNTEETSKQETNRKSNNEMVAAKRLSIISSISSFKSSPSKDSNILDIVTRKRSLPYNQEHEIVTRKRSLPYNQEHEIELMAPEERVTKKRKSMKDLETSPPIRHKMTTEMVPVTSIESSIAAVNDWLTRDTQAPDLMIGRDMLQHSCIEAERNERERLVELLDKYREGLIKRVPWTKLREQEAAHLESVQKLCEQEAEHLKCARKIHEQMAKQEAGHLESARKIHQQLVERLESARKLHEQAAQLQTGQAASELAHDAAAWCRAEGERSRALCDDIVAELRACRGRP